MTKWAARLAVVALLCPFPMAAIAATLEIGYVEVESDRRYDETLAYAGLLLKPAGRPFGGAKLAVNDGAFLGATVGLEFQLQRQTAKDAKGLATLVEKMRREGNVRIFLVDAPAAAVKEVAQATRGRDLVLFNVSAQEDDLRGRACQANLFHTIPSDAMLADALAQFLAGKQWRKVLVLQGASPEDEIMGAAFARAAKRFGVEIVDRRPFVLSNDPREREANNIALLTGDADYDVVLTADNQGEFGRSVPYQTLKPRPVVGTAGLGPTAWHWSWERHGAPQLTRRFDRQEGRRMQSADWAAWIAARAVMDAAVRSGSVETAAILKFLRSDQLALDGFKGPALNFRAWDNQLRQPIFLASENWVAATAPLSGFLHASHNLDSLGVDQPESSCRF